MSPGNYERHTSPHFAGSLCTARATPGALLIGRRGRLNSRFRPDNYLYRVYAAAGNRRVMRFFRFRRGWRRIDRMVDKATQFPPPPGPRFARRVPDGDTMERYVCGDCGHIYYSNPKIVVGSVVSHNSQILLCRRAIEPRKGYWTLPAGYLEEHETPEDGARREAREEALCDIAIDGLLAVYSIARLSQVQLMYRATLAAPAFGAGEESLEVKLFAWEDIPWTELAFPSVTWALNYYRQTKGDVVLVPGSNPV
jgi:ADP-ribose pyrophosphatase YjhB (NUDIX family)